MKRRLLKSVLLLIIFIIIIISTVVFASTTTNKNFCVLQATNLGGSRTEQDLALEYARNVYMSNGYTTNWLVDPSALLISANAAGNQFQLYFCHGNTGIVEFPAGGLCTGSSFYNSQTNQTFNSIEGIDWSNKELVVLAACKTAGDGSFDENSITYEITVAGAQMTIGWFKQVYSFSTPDWLNNFHDYLADGYNALEAMNYANSFIYLSNNTKDNAAVYYTPPTIVENIRNIKIKNERNILSSEEIGKYDENKVFDLIKKYDESFDVNNYEKSISEGLYCYNIEKKEKEYVEKYIDFKLKIGDFITKSGYTVVLNNSNKIIEILDNTIVDIEEVKKYNEDLVSVNCEKSVEFINRAKKELKTDKKIIDEESLYYYDIEGNKKYIYITLEIEDEILGSRLESFVYEI